MVDTPDMFQDIPVIFLDRKRMKVARAWRCFVELPRDRANLPEVLTAYIESEVRIELRGETTVDMDPAWIFDVPSAKGGKFHLVFETVSEQQSFLGPKLTALIGKEVRLTIL